ncbi:MAG: DUF749 family protein [Halobacteriota archaeon]|nr:DUF749 family protein [Halobacteriota archaeon]
MTHIATVAAITKVANVTEELMPFVQFKAEKEGRELSGSESVAILQIEGTESYHPIFLPAKIEDIEEELKELDVVLNSDAKKSIMKVV